MRRSLHGVRQLGQALHDFEQARPLRAVDEDGQVKRTLEGSSDQTLSDIYLRNEFPPHGKAKAARPGDTPTDRYNNALDALSKAFDDLEQRFVDLSKVVGEDGQPLVDARGVELRLTEAWREILRRVDEEAVIWARAFRKMYGAKSNANLARTDDDDGEEDQDPYADVDDDNEDAERADVNDLQDEEIAR
ncbi:MAG: hypothetical protein EOS28_32570 [Mesorhizobium sp.]|nr:MAG: hypothetical protein EOS28_32570 [Mesorhizobium sp.]